MTGKKFGRLQALCEAKRPKRSNRKVVFWKCVCDCGRIDVFDGAHLRGGTTKSCGCLARELFRKRVTKHGKSRSQIYRLWWNMRTRCSRKSDRGFSNYGGRGIVVCNRWLRSFLAFYADMGDPPFPGAQIDRIDNNGPYSPKNCRWASVRQQCRNKRTNHILAFDGKRLPLVVWAEETGIRSDTILRRIRAGWGIEHALTRQPRPVSRLLTHQGRTQSLSEWANQLGMKTGTLSARLRSGWDISDSLTLPVRS